MRYLANTETDKITTVADDDDKRFYELLAERTSYDRPLYEQTGAHDPRVSQVVLPGQDPTEPIAATADQGEAVPGEKIAPEQPAPAKK